MQVEYTGRQTEVPAPIRAASASLERSSVTGRPGKRLVSVLPQGREQRAVSHHGNTQFSIFSRKILNTDRIKS